LGRWKWKKEEYGMTGKARYKVVEASAGMGLGEGRWGEGWESA